VTVERIDRLEYTALADRMMLLLPMRAAFATIVMAWAAWRPELLGISMLQLGAACLGYVAIGLAGEIGRRLFPRRGLLFLSFTLLIDGVFLALVSYATGGTQSPIRFLIYLHLVAVSLLASYRTGLKVALWHSLLLFVVLYAQAAELLPAVDVLPGRQIEFDRMPVLNVTSFWLFALATSLFSAMNERELRNRRADLQSLVEISARLDAVTDPILQSRLLLDGLAELFGFECGLVLGATPDGQAIVLASREAGDLPTSPAPVDSVIQRSWTELELLPVRRLDAARNPLLAAAFGDARNLIVAPMIADSRALGAVVVAHRSRRRTGLERRVVNVLGQLCSMAALNLRNAVLLRDIQTLAERDALTGAANRRMFNLALERTLTGAPRGSSVRERVTAVLFIDLDDFKVVNDTLGHAAGDALLVNVTERIAQSVRDSDLVARLGGDEFAVLTNDAPDLHQSVAMAQRLVRDLRAPYLIDGHHIVVTVSIGIASTRDTASTASDVIRNADLAMYIAKANGKAGYAIFDPGMHAVIRDRHELGTQLLSAVELRQFHAVYQPIVSLSTGRIEGVEALVRWDHPQRGIVSPGDFIEIAEENGAILPIGRWVLSEACREARAWSTREHVPFLCVNVSAREIQQADFVDAVAWTLREAGLDPGLLRLEITETALLRATPTTINTLEALRGLGVHIVIDDFGTGYFSLSHLRQFPVDGLKIAREFVQVSPADSKSMALASAIVAMSSSMNIETVAEGIETAEQAERMRKLGCTYGQGYFFARPQAGGEVIAETLGLIAVAGKPVAPRRQRRRRVAPAVEPSPALAPEAA
jgi:diguanylate cyclase (GGDEF)-like protein